MTITNWGEIVADLNRKSKEKKEGDKGPGYKIPNRRESPKDKCNKARIRMGAGDEH